jgi:anti-sigma factor RsiW
MTCAQIEPELVAYHFGLVSDDTRELVEVHLASCSACLRAFLELKRAIETNQGDPPPSKAARARLRSAVAAELGVRTPAEVESRRRWWERPLAVAIAASVVLVAGATTRALTSGPGSPPYALSQGRAPR